MSTYDPSTGEVHDAVEAVELVPLNLAALSEDELIELFPSPIQVAGALIMARQRIARAPAVLKDLAEVLKSAKRKALVERGLAYQRAREAGFNITDARVYAQFDDKTIDAQEAVDTAELALEYGRDMRRSLTTDIDILRSLNANFRQEHKP